MNATTTVPDPQSQPQAFLRSLYDAAVRRAMPLHNMAAVLPPVPKGRTLVLGAGKAGASMVHALEALWPQDAPLSGLVVTRYGHLPERPAGVPARVDIVEAAHPVPDAAGLMAAERMLELDWFEDSITSGGSVQKLALFLTGEPDEFTITARMGVADRQDELDEDELQETRSAIETYFDLNDVKVQLSSQGYDWSGLAGIECEISLLEGENGGSRGFGGQGSDSGDGVTGYFEWHMFRGSVNIDDMEDEDERDAAEQAAVLVEQGDQEGALQALPALWFEYNMDNLDSSPDEFMPGSQQVYFEANYANPDHDIVLDYEDGTLIVTATIRFPMQVNPGVDEDEINDWLSENGGYAAGFLSANWSYNGDEGGHFVFR